VCVCVTESVWDSDRIESLN